MKRIIDLNGKWQMKNKKHSEWIEAVVPGSVYSDLLRAGQMKDPYYRDHEDSALALSMEDYEYFRHFDVDGELLACDEVVLSCKGLDTLAEIRINGQTVAHTNNMHRTYEFDVKKRLQEGSNTIHFVFSSPLKYIQQKHKEDPIWSPDHAVAGFPHLRKGHYMFGWDWGPKLPDAGIWRNIGIQGSKTAKLKDVHLTQQHEVHSETRLVTLSVNVNTICFTQQPVEVNVKVTGPEGSGFETEQWLTGINDHGLMVFPIENPQLWWPNLYGEQPLYKVEVVLDYEGDVLDRQTYRIGLRTLTVKREKDQWGESFEFEVNGISIFAQGANYIPEDNLLSRCNAERTEKLLKQCMDANYNCIRVWGGGVYPEDYFYDLCDRYGLIVWQDLMFACGIYRMTDEFAANIRHEAIDNVKRIRHHASLGLWCGNNEMEWGWEEWDIPKTPQLRTDYIKQFEVLLPQVVKEYDPQTFYWVASPSSGGSFDKPNDEHRGDVHYWEVWGRLKPFTDYRKYFFRFCSEFGFQSFPGMKTIESFTLPEDRNIFSYIMEKHQKDGSGNGKILTYLSDQFKYPKSLELLAYTSQILQAEAIKYGVEHWRRNRGRCMGSIYWQLNDCWPAASWSSIDSFGRWKALHYYARRFYAPILLSACEEGAQVKLHLTNDSLGPASGIIEWKLRDHKSSVLRSGKVKVSVESLGAKLCTSLDFSDDITGDNQRIVYLEYEFMKDGEIVSNSSLIFAKPKHFDYLDPQIDFEVTETPDRFVIKLESRHYAGFVGLELQKAECRFSDNYFHLSAGSPREIQVLKDTISESLTVEQLRTQLRITTAYDIA
ncbi:glycoside hydrolase family 2 protein [Paenibacillus sp. LHD-117]|uniref:beta-mannosidase n=1 Tax=Paenibacillus sp. LHD-117 TaxID=3071412 RepID=UPI0027E150A9|nr:glycoside hydrolase family 2 protein [Paenibacillus sp. LHD-117]MDQ6423602.1 glycoside hydrolase family 2 protein [Paenibacillus sp. LHD-117]